MDSAAEAAQEEAYHAAAANQEAVSAAASPAAPVRRFRIPKPFLIAGAAAVALIAGGIATYLYLYQTPERIVGTMFDRLESVEAFEYAGEMKGSFEQPQTPDITCGAPDADPAISCVSPGTERPSAEDTTFSFSSEGSIDVRNDDEPKFQGLLAVAVGMEGLDISAEGELRNIGDTSYFKLNKVPTFGIVSLEEFKDQWFEADPESVKEETGVDIAGESREWLSQDKQRRVSEAFRKSGALTLEKKGSEEVDGTATHRIGYRVDEGKLRTLAAELYRIVEDKEMNDDQRQELDDALEEAEFKPGDLWIGKSDYLPRKITGGLSGEGETGSSTLTIELSFKNYNQDVPAITVPEGAKPVSELSSLLEGDANPGEGADTDRDGLTDSEESLYQTDPQRADTDEDGHSDGDEVKNGYDPLGPGRLEPGAQPAI